MTMIFTNACIQKWDLEEQQEHLHLFTIKPWHCHLLLYCGKNLCCLSAAAILSRPLLLWEKYLTNVICCPYTNPRLMKPKLYQTRGFTLANLSWFCFVGNTQSLPLRNLLYNQLRMVAQAQGRNSSVSACVSCKYDSGSMALFILPSCLEGSLPNLTTAIRYRSSTSLTNMARNVWGAFCQV